MARVNNAREEITVFGLTRNFYAKDDMLPLFEAKAAEIPVTFSVMDPHCDSRRDRYRIEPVELQWKALRVICEKSLGRSLMLRKE